MVSTRSATSSPVKKTAVVKSVSTPEVATEQPLRIVVAPKDISQKARFLCLPSPVDGKVARYLFCPEKGVLELKQITTPKHDPRSVLFVPSGRDDLSTKEGALGSGYVNKDADCMIATSLDLCFILLPIASRSEKSNLFQTTDDLLETSLEGSFDLRYVLTNARPMVEEALETICDSIEAGDEHMYRYSPNKTLQLLVKKARKVCEKGLPATLEDRFVTRVLEAPVLSVKREESAISLAAEPEDVPERIDTPIPSDNQESQSSAARTAPSIVFSEASLVTQTTIATVVPDSRVPEDINSLQRLLTAFKFITACYTSPLLGSRLLGLLQTSESEVDFRPLDSHLAHLAKLRAEAAASTDLSSFSRKRSNFEDDEEAEDRADKRRKLEEEEKRRKANTSHGVKALAKVNTKGMKKMSAFFAPKPAKPAG